MKKCKFCAEDIQDEAIKCKHCGEMLNNSKKKRFNCIVKDEKGIQQSWWFEGENEEAIRSHLQGKGWQLVSAKEAIQSLNDFKTESSGERNGFGGSKFTTDARAVAKGIKEKEWHDQLKMIFGFISLASACLIGYLFKNIIVGIVVLAIGVSMTWAWYYRE